MSDHPGDNRTNRNRNRNSDSNSYVGPLIPEEAPLNVHPDGNTYDSTTGSSSSPQHQILHRQYETFPLAPPASYSYDSNSNSSEEQYGLLATKSAYQTNASNNNKKKAPQSHRRNQSSTVSLNAAVTLPRLVRRDLPHYQSSQTVCVVNRHGSSNVRPLRYGYDWFHVLLRWETKQSVALIVIVWTSVNLFFGLVYKLLDARNPGEDCGLASKPGKVIGFMGAFAFSLETCTTVGYTLPGGKNGFFENCPGLQAAIYCQMMYSMLFNAFLFAFFFSRLARAETRGNQVMFSNKAIIEQGPDGKWLFHARIYDLDAGHPVVEAHCHLYAVSWKDYDQQDHQQPHLLHTMRVLRPNDDLGATLFTSVPSTITHHIDVYSPLAPAHVRDVHNVVQRHGLPLREVDRMTENNGGIPCPVCGETYGTFDNLKNHIEYNSLTETHDKVPVEGSHRDTHKVPSSYLQPARITEMDLRMNLLDKEVMVVVEGIEPLISGTFQALHSYTSEDIYFHGRFAPCMSTKDGNIFVDLLKFHEVTPRTGSTPAIATRKQYGS